MSLAHANALLSPRGHAYGDFGVLLDLAGREVLARGPSWRLNHATRHIKLNWRRLGELRPATFIATQSFVAQIVKTYNASTVERYFENIVCLSNFSPFLKGESSAEDIEFGAIMALRTALGERGYGVRFLRDWYSWCADQGHPGFCPEVAFRLEEVVFGGNRRAVAVRTMDPEGGPLVDTEVVALLNALRASEVDDRLTLQEQVAVWLCIALGGNAQHYALMQEEDFNRFTYSDGDDVIFQIRVPRMKKGHVRERMDFKARKLIPQIGLLVEELLRKNRARFMQDHEADLGSAMPVPLFMREVPLENLLGTPMHEYALAFRAAEFTRMISAAVAKLGVISPRTSRPLHATCRRLRYTFATRLVREGASQRVVAEALDHTDLQHVQCYFDLKSDIVEKLDQAMAMALGPLAQAFLGHLVPSEADAVRGGDRASRIYRHDKNSRALQPVGTCGSFSFCGLAAPVACYTCIKFQPWVEAPHEEVLSDLLTERERRQTQGLDGKMVALFDNTILAVADVVARVAQAWVAFAEAGRVG